MVCCPSLGLKESFDSVDRLRSVSDELLCTVVDGLWCGGDTLEVLGLHSIESAPSGLILWAGRSSTRACLVEMRIFSEPDDGEPDSLVVVETLSSEPSRNGDFDVELAATDRLVFGLPPLLLTIVVVVAAVVGAEEDLAPNTSKELVVLVTFTSEDLKLPLSFMVSISLLMPSPFR